MNEITIERENQRAVVHPNQDVVAASVPNLRTFVRSALDSGVRDLVLDLNGVQMLDSSGLGLLIAAHNSLQKLGGRISVIHASPEILGLFQTMRLHQHFSVSGD